MKQLCNYRGWLRLSQLLLPHIGQRRGGFSDCPPSQRPKTKKRGWEWFWDTQQYVCKRENSEINSKRERQARPRLGCCTLLLAALA